VPSPSSLIDDLFGQCAQLPVLDLERIEPAIPTLFGVFAQVTDGRARCGRRYRLATVLSIALLAVLCGARSIRAVSRLSRSLQPAHLDLLGSWLDRHGQIHAPTEVAFRTAFDATSPDELDDAIGRFLQHLQTDWAGQDLIGYGIDGKTIRGATDPEGHQPHLVAAIRQDTKTIVAQRQVEAKSSEHAALKPVVKSLGETRGAVIVADALHTTRANACFLTHPACGAHYVFSIKHNQPTLFNLVNALPWDERTWAHTETIRSKGRTEKRSINVLPAPPGAFPGAAQVFLISRITHGPGLGKGRYICHLGITSLTADQAGPAQLAAFVRNEWGIEVVHNIRDVTYREDASRVRTGHRPRIMATLRNLAISLIRLSNWSSMPAAHEHYRDNKHDALALLGLTS
jgi:hypothetical protein